MFVPDVTRTYTSVDAGVPRGTPNLRHIASQWMFVNAFDDGTIFADRGRVFPPERGPGDASPMDALLRSVEQYRNYDVCLLMSGGIDSRALLALLVRAGIRPHVITFGTPDMPDCIAAQQIARVVDVPCTFIDVTDVRGADAERAMIDVACRSEGTYSIAHAAVLPLLADVVHRSARPMVLDGAFGGLLRGGLGNGLLIKAWRGLANRNARSVARAAQIRTFEVFNAGLHHDMYEAAVASLQNALDLAPPFRIGAAREWMDAFSLRWYVPNYVANAGCLFQDWFPCDMPYTNSDTIAAVLGAPVAERKRAKLFRNLIQTETPGAWLVPLVGKRGWYPSVVAGTTLGVRLAEKVHTFRAHSSIERVVARNMARELARMTDRGLSSPLFDSHVVRSLSPESTAHFEWCTLALALTDQIV